MNIDSDSQHPQNILSCEQPEYDPAIKPTSSNSPFFQEEGDILLKYPYSPKDNNFPESRQMGPDSDKDTTNDSANRKIDDTENHYIEPVNEAADFNVALNLQLSDWNEGVDPASYDSEITEERRLFNLALPEAKIHLTQTACFFIAMILTSICVLLPLNGAGYSSVVLIAPMLFAFTWIILEVRCRADILTDLWLESSDFFRSFDMSNVMILIISWEFKIAEIVTTCIYASLSFYAVAHVFIYVSRSSIKKHLPGILTRYYYGFQVMILALRIDGYTDGSWNWTLLLTWIFLAIKTCGYFISLARLLRKVIKMSSLSIKTRTIGFLWQLGFKGLILVPMVTMYGFNLYQGPEKDFSVITKVAYGNIVVNAILLAGILFGREHILNFLIKAEVIKSLLVDYERGVMTVGVKNENENTICLDKEKKEEYFVMVSPTYFRPLSLDSYTKINEAVLKNKGKLFKLAKAQKTKVNPQDEDIEQLKREIKAMRDVNDLEAGCGNKFQTSIPEDVSCYICCYNPSNVVFTGCGHGGICYDCAVSLVKKKNECMECRKEVEGIFKIQQSSKVFEIVKGYEFHKVSKC